MKGRLKTPRCDGKQYWMDHQGRVVVQPCREHPHAVSRASRSLGMLILAALVLIIGTLIIALVAVAR